MAPFSILFQLALAYLSCSRTFATGHTLHHRHNHRRHNHSPSSRSVERAIDTIRELHVETQDTPAVSKKDAVPPGRSDPKLRRDYGEALSQDFLNELQQQIASLDSDIRALLDIIRGASNSRPTQSPDSAASTVTFSASPPSASPVADEPPAPSVGDTPPTPSAVDTSSSVNAAASTNYQPAPATTSPANTGSSSSSSGSYSFDPQASTNLAVYYGQTGATGNVPLDTLCSDPTVDIVILAFLNEYFAGGGYPEVNFGAACGGQTPQMVADETNLLYCADLMQRIQTCQQIGKKVFISLGGAIATSAFTSDQQASQFAQTVWDLFGGGTGLDPGLRPFGNVTLDGFDVDNENHSTDHYPAFFDSLRTLANSAPSAVDLEAGRHPKRYYISAAPQCIRPDASIPLSSMQTDADFIWVQFFNNPDCNIGSSGFEASLKAWSTDLMGSTSPSTISKTRRDTSSGPKLLIGAPAFSAGGSGYMDAADLSTLIETVKGWGLENFGGVMLWDGSEAVANTDSQGKTYLQDLNEALKG